MYFHALSFSALWAILVAKGAQKGGFGGTFDAILGAGPKGENRCFMYTGARFRRFWRVSKSMKFEPFFASGKKCSLGRHF